MRHTWILTALLWTTAARAEALSCASKGSCHVQEKGVSQKRTVHPESPVPQITVDVSACAKMLEILKGMRSGSLDQKAASAAIDALIDEPAYRWLFGHYNRASRPNHLPRETFRRMIVSLRFPLQYKNGENARADRMKERWLKAWDAPDAYEKNLAELAAAPWPTLMRTAAKRAAHWLPEGAALPPSTLVVLPDGGSNGWVHPTETVQGYDFFQFARQSNGRLDWEAQGALFAHELHHLGMQGFSYRNEPTDPRKAAAFSMLTFFLGEGMPTRFLDDAPGGCLPPRPGSQTFLATPELRAEWKTYTQEEPEMFARLARTFETFLTRDPTPEELAEFRAFWQNQGAQKQRRYFFGSEVLGAIELAHGRKILLAALADPQRIPALYNEALSKKSEALKGCPRFPSGFVAQALSLR